MIESKDIKEIGKFQKTHALKGELNAILEIDPEFVSDGNALIVDVDSIYVPFYASSVRSKGATSFLIKLDGIDSEEEARLFVNKSVYGLKAELAAFLDMEEDELLDEEDLTGYRIIDKTTGSMIGTVVCLDSSTDNLLFVVEAEDGSEIFIPAVDDFIYSIDDNMKIITMSLPEGLVDINKKG